MASSKVSPRRHDLRSGEEDLLNSGDFDVSASLSPGKFDRQLEKIMNDQRKQNQDDDFEELMSNIEKESNHMTIDGGTEAASMLKMSPDIKHKA